MKQNIQGIITLLMIIINRNLANIKNRSIGPNSRKEIIIRGIRHPAINLGVPDSKQYWTDQINEFSLRREDQIMLVESAKNKSIEEDLKGSSILRKSLKNTHGMIKLL